ncbi:hypothetical protein [Methylococcus sp. EFPC2]|uniref:hypothetical protein n=1 Tax=Methylococcus sp. EFPC2 TaxID=2812648 RepID=UPI0019687689|nr:hypothetical protein [Methylococcus sp. EFPC2]QSA98821.1 hypothetical protein JWZ97_08605 [Methylococcus sp. EFPC2]
MANTAQITVSTDAPDLRDGLQARIHDPLWLLARQWQLGEFQGEDAGSPVAARVRYEAAPLSLYRPGSEAAGLGARPYAPGALPLETLVEREPVIAAGIPDWRAAAESGLHLLRLLAGTGLGGLRAPLLAAGFGLAPADPAADGDSRAFLGVVAGRVVDGTALRSRLAPLIADGRWQELFQQAPFGGVAEADRPRLQATLEAWLAWHGERFGPAVEQAEAWVPERIEYEFAVAGALADGEVVLAAPEYQEGRLDWHAFTGRPGASLGAAPDFVLSSRAFLPAPVDYPGMPAPRFWEFEDGRINFARIEAQPGDAARRLLLDFALEFGNDWFVLPLELAVGSLCRVRSLTVTNSFGEQLLFPHASETDPAPSPWQAFTLSQADPRLFFLAPALGAGLQGSPLEDVHFLRDEMANVAWAVERVVQGPAGRPLDRYEAYQQALSRQDQAIPVERKSGAPLRYRLGTTVPDYWVPLLPVRKGTSMRLKRAALPHVDTEGMHGLQEPQGRILTPGNELLLHDEEVPREGSRVTRSYQYVRWSNGSSHLWVGRRKQPGRGEGSSGLQFDVIESG